MQWRQIWFCRWQLLPIAIISLPLLFWCPSCVSQSAWYYNNKLAFHRILSTYRPVAFRHNKRFSQQLSARTTAPGSSWLQFVGERGEKLQNPLLLCEHNYYCSTSPNPSAHWQFDSHWVQQGKKKQKTEQKKILHHITILFPHSYS